MFATLVSILMMIIGEAVVSEIRLDELLPEQSLDGIEDFSHAEIIFYFGQVANQENIPVSRHPRGNKDWPKVGFSHNAIKIVLIILA